MFYHLFDSLIILWVEIVLRSRRYVMRCSFRHVVKDLFRLPLCFSNFPVIGSTYCLSVMSAFGNGAVGEGGVREYLPPCRDYQYIVRYIPGLNACWFVAMSVGQALTLILGNEKCETA